MLLKLVKGNGKRGTGVWERVYSGNTSENSKWRRKRCLQINTDFIARSPFVFVIAWARGQLRINFTRIFKVFTKLPESRSDEGNLENFENASEINP